MSPSPSSLSSPPLQPFSRLPLVGLNILERKPTRPLISASLLAEVALRGPKEDTPQAHGRKQCAARDAHQVGEQPGLGPHCVAVEGARRVVREGSDKCGLGVWSAVVIRVRYRWARRERHCPREHQAQCRECQECEPEQSAQVVFQVGSRPYVRTEHGYDHAWAQQHRQCLRREICRRAEGVGVVDLWIGFVSWIASYWFLRAPLLTSMSVMED